MAAAAATVTFVRPVCFVQSPPSLHLRGRAGGRKRVAAAPHAAAPVLKAHRNGSLRARSLAKRPRKSYIPKRENAGDRALAHEPAISNAPTPTRGRLLSLEKCKFGLAQRRTSHDRGNRSTPSPRATTSINSHGQCLHFGREARHSLPASSTAASCRMMSSCVWDHARGARPSPTELVLSAGYT